jgi:DNA repair protein RecO (recombination protein O)
MLVHTAAIILRTIKYGDTSLIVDILTPSQGRCSIMVKGARKPNKSGATKASTLQPGFLVQMSMAYQSGKAMQLSNDFSASNICMQQLSMPQLGVITFVTEIIDKCIHGGEVDADIFDTLWQILAHCFNRASDISYTPIYTVLQCARHLGFQITGAYSAITPTLNLKAGVFDMQSSQNNIQVVSGEEAQLISAINNLSALGTEIPSTRPVRQAALKYVLQYLEIHIGKSINLQSLGVWQSVFE